MNVSNLSRKSLLEENRRLKETIADFEKAKVECHNIEAVLRESENNLRALFNAMQDIVFEMDYDGTYLNIAPTAPELMAKPPNEVIGKTVHYVFPKLEADMFLAFIRECLDNKEIRTIEYPLELNGATVWFEGRATPKTERTVLYIARDITSRKLAEEALMENELRYRSLYENSPFGIVICRLIRDESNKAIDAVFLQGNKAASIHTGFDLTNIAGKKASDFCRLDEIAELLKKYHPATTEGQPVSYNQYLPIFDRILSLTVFKLYKDIYILNFIDISEHKRAEEAIAEAAKKWQITFNAMSDSVCIISADSYFKQCNAATFKILDITEREMAEKHCYQIVHGLDSHIDNCPLQRMKLSKQKEFMTFYSNSRWLEVTVDPIFDDNGRIEGAVHVVSDITERRQAEEELKKHRDHLEKLVKERTERLEAQKADLENMNKVFVGREFRIKELREEVKELKKKVNSEQ
ncbi:MAG: PAS domain S-box protein [Candidatus Cloacimonetes bacterium]|nr:PAS domain S-box protein [Candidatus Cloacimonadota bacterium]